MTLGLAAASLCSAAAAAAVGDGDALNDSLRISELPRLRASALGLAAADRGENERGDADDMAGVDAVRLSGLLMREDAGRVRPRRPPSPRPNA